MYVHVPMVYVMCIYEFTIMYTLLQFKYVPTVKDIFMVGYRVT